MLLLLLLLMLLLRQGGQQHVHLTLTESCQIQLLYTEHRSMWGTHTAVAAVQNGTAKVRTSAAVLCKRLYDRVP
jgi:hypothetical protein